MSIVFIHGINMMWAIDFRVLVSRLLMGNKWNFKVLSYKALLIQLVLKQSILLILLSQILNYVVAMDLRFCTFLSCYFNDFMFCFQICCEGSRCLDDTRWVSAPVFSKNGLTVTLTVSSSCVGHQLYGLRYLWRETPCPFKQAAIYSATDPNLPSPPYLKLF